MHHLIPAPPYTDLQDLIRRTRTFVQSAKSPAAIKAYRRDWINFKSWCKAHRLDFLPATPNTVALYISDIASNHAVSTIMRRLTSITMAHKSAGHLQSPSTSKNLIVGGTMKGIRRTLGTAQHGKDPLLTADIRKVIGRCPKGLLGLRDRALLLVGFSGAFRRSELSSIDVQNISLHKDGVVIELVRSKTDQEGEGRKVGIVLGNNPRSCPVRTLQKWLKHAGITEGPAFRAVDRHGNVSDKRLHPDSIGKLIKRAAARAGMKVSAISGHS